MHLRTTTIVESPLAAAVIWKMLTVAQQKFRRLKQVYLGVKYADGMEITRTEVAA